MHTVALPVKTAALTLLLLLLAACRTGPASADELDRIVEVLAIEKGMTVADVGAGDGEWSIALAERVGGSGHVFATEVDEDELQAIQQRIERNQISNLTPILGSQEDTGLPNDCCHAVLLRMVYHHFVDPVSMLASLRQALRPNGLLAVIDIVPQQHWRQLEDVPERGGHGIPPEDLIEEISRQGFELLARYDDWKDEADRFCIVFRPVSRSDP